MDNQSHISFSPEYQTSLDELNAAGEQLARLHQNYEDSRRKYDRLLAEPIHRQSNPTYLTEKKTTEDFLTELAHELGEAASRRNVAKEVHDKYLSETHAENLQKWQTRLHELAIQADTLLDALATIFAEMKSLHVEIRSSEVAAGIRGQDVSRRERNIGSVVVNTLGIAELRRLTWTPSRGVGKKLSEVYPDPTEVAPIIKKEVQA